MNSRALASATKKAAWTATPVNRGVLQRQCACGQHTIAGGGCEACGGKTHSLQRRLGEHAGPSTVPPIVHEVLRSPGRPLDRSARAALEPGFDRDFSHVRVHTDGRASESARAVNASAYTVGRDIVFAANRYAPATGAGASLLAHELAHTIQQGGAGPFGSGSLNISPTSDPSEREADRAAEAVVVGQPAKLQSETAIGIQRQHEGDIPAKEDFKQKFLNWTSPKDQHATQDSTAKSPMMNPSHGRQETLDLTRPEWRFAHPRPHEKSAAEHICETLVDPAVHALHLPKKIEAKVMTMTRNWVASGLSSGVKEAVAALGVTDARAQEIIQDCVKAAILAKPQAQP